MALTDYQKALMNKILSVPSVGSAPEEGAPYGRRSREVLDIFLNEASSSGFRTGVIDDKVGWVEFGSGDRLIGIVCHLDVVPAGDGWNSDPFTPVERDGSIYARGIVDDKGPALAAFFAMKKLLLEDTGLNARIRLILGTDEERTCDCVETYAAKGEIPDFSITPDAEFPVIYAEKGILHIKISDNGKSTASATGGDAANMVPAHASLTAPDSDGNIKTVISEGKPAHASKPDLGKNAIEYLPIIAADNDIDISAIPLLSFTEKYLTSHAFDRLTGCSVRDESGSLTLSAGILRLGSEGGYMILDIRYPVTASESDIIDNIRNAAATFGLSADVESHMAPLYKERNAPEIRLLTEIWRTHMDKFTGFEDDHRNIFTDPIAIGGGTYARHMPNTIAFGLQAPWNEDQCHQADEHMAISDFEECIKILEEAIIGLSDL